MYTSDIRWSQLKGEIMVIAPQKCYQKVPKDVLTVLH